MKNKTCYVVTAEGEEHTTIYSICLSEETAKKEFYKIKRKLVRESKKYYYRKEKTKLLKKCKYPGTNDIGGWVFERPYVKKFKILE